MKLIKAENINDLLAKGLKEENIEDINNYMQMEKVTSVTFSGLHTMQQVLIAAKAAAFFGIPNVQFENCDLSKGALEVSKVLFSYPIRKVEFTSCKGIIYNRTIENHENGTVIAEAAVESNSLEYIGFSNSLFNTKTACPEIVNILSKSSKSKMHVDLSNNFFFSGHPHKGELDRQVDILNAEKVAYKNNVQSLLQEPDVIFHGTIYEKGIINLIGQYADDACVLTMHWSDFDNGIF